MLSENFGCPNTLGKYGKSFFHKIYFGNCLNFQGNEFLISLTLYCIDTHFDASTLDSF